MFESCLRNYKERFGVLFFYTFFFFANRLKTKRTLSPLW